MKKLALIVSLIAGIVFADRTATQGWTTGQITAATNGIPAAASAIAQQLVDSRGFLKMTNGNARVEWNGASLTHAHASSPVSLYVTNSTGYVSVPDMSDYVTTETLAESLQINGYGQFYADMGMMDYDTIFRPMWRQQDPEDPSGTTDRVLAFIYNASDSSVADHTVTYLDASSGSVSFSLPSLYRSEYDNYREPRDLVVYIDATAASSISVTVTPSSGDDIYTRDGADLEFQTGCINALYLSQIPYARHWAAYVVPLKRKGGN